jgi:DNA-directed RNA polymerase subunit beta'
MKEIQDFDSIKIRLASPEQIKSWSYGEVKKPETINYRTLRPEKDGLFCERIFGTTKDWECYCGKFKSVRYKGVICDRCGVEVTSMKVRRERMGHIELACPVSHIWYYRSVPSRMGLLLDMSMQQLRSVLYYEKYIVTDPGDTDLKKMQLLAEDEYIQATIRWGSSFSAGIGAEAIRTLLEEIDLESLNAQLRAKMVDKGEKADKRLLKRIEIVENFLESGNKPSWMILSVIPVIPPDLRPMVQLDGGRFATSDLNDLYRRVINRNNRLKRLQSLNAPDIIIRNEKRMLQEAVDGLFDNSKKKKMLKGQSNRALKSLSDLLKGKQGRFRQNLLGKRVDYSGRSVIIVGPELKLHQCGLPAKMAIELYKPFIIKKLVEKDIVYNIKKAKILVEQETEEVYAILDEVVREHPVLLNRAPTLHRLGIQAFEPVLIEGKAIRLHPLVCHAYNADFDGDQMAVHVPLTAGAQAECWNLMLSVNNLLNPANGKPIVFPSQDMVLGISYLTREMKGAKGEGKVFSSEEEAIRAAEEGYISYHALIKVPTKAGWTVTTPGRLIFNEKFPKDIDFVNQPLGDAGLKNLIGGIFAKFGAATTVKILDLIKDLGFKYATYFGASIGVSDIVVPEIKRELIEKAKKQESIIRQQYQDGVITGEERYNKIVDIWTKTNDELTAKMMENLKKDQNGFNPVYLMADSGARGSKNQIRQLAGMRGLMSKPSGEIIELPIISNFKEGLSVIEYFISTNGARKGLADTALKTSNAGYLTRRLVDIAQDVVISEEDCGTINGVEITALKDGEDIIERLADRIVGRFTLEQVVHPITGEIIVDMNEEISEEKAELIEEVGIESVIIRTVFTCESKHGVCQRCYGRNLATNRTVNIGEAVGIVAAQSIGQPGTQLTMRTFHIGGVATKGSEENRILLKFPTIIQRIQGSFVTQKDGNLLSTRKSHLFVSRIYDEVTIQDGDKVLVQEGQKVLERTPLLKRKGEEVHSKHVAFVHFRENKLFLISQEKRVEIRNGSSLMVKVGDIVPANETIAIFDQFAEPIIAEYDGKIVFKDIISGATLKEEINPETNKSEKRIQEAAHENLDPTILIVNDAGEELAKYVLPGGAYLSVENGMKIHAGTILARLPKESGKTQDIVGGLPKVESLFEARRPTKSPAVLAEVSGTVRFEAISKGKRVMVIVDDFGNEIVHKVPLGRLLLVRNGDRVEAGESLCVGEIDPHDVLRILGENALQSYLVNEVQGVYRLQGVSINDKHIGIIIRQMMRKVEIQEVGDTKFIYNQQVDKYVFNRENERILREGGQPAVARPMLLGITKAAVSIESFISAASFQETTRVLTNAAISGKVDELRGLKENVIIGHLIPAGTGMKRYRQIKITDHEGVDLDVYVQEVLKKREQERERLQALAVIQEDEVEKEVFISDVDEEEDEE